MKKILTTAVFFTVMILTSNFNLLAQPLTGPKNIPGDYATIEAAITALNANGVGAGGVTFNVAAGHTETFSSATAGLITATGTAANSIIFQKNGAGANPLITASGLGIIATSTTLGNNGDAVINIEGGDYITFDGIDIQENGGATGSQLMENGYLLTKISGDDACKNVTIKNCFISLLQTTRYSQGIYISNLVGGSDGTVTSIGGRSENIKIFNNTISNVYVGIQVRGDAAASPYDFYDQNIEIGVDGGNSITNFGGGASTAYGVYAIYQNNLKVGNNLINGGSGTTTTLYGVFTSTGTNSNIDIYSNNVTISGGGTTSTIYAINNAIGSTGTDNTVNIYNNIVENCSYPTATSGAFYGIYNSASGFNVNMYGNTVRNNSRPGTTGTTYLLYNSSTGVNGFSNIYNNSIYGNSTTASTGDLYCLYSNEVATATKMVYGNMIYNNSGNDDVYALYSALGVVVHIYKNNIYNITSNTTLTTSPYVSGIAIGSGTDVYVYNNFISDLKAPNSAATDAIRGINFLTATTNATRSAYYNTIFLNATSSGTNFGSSGIFHIYNTTSTTAALDMRNNNIVNNSTANGTGFTVAFRRSASTNLNNYGDISNNNNFYAGTPGASNLLYYDGTNAIQNISDLKLFLNPREAVSVSGNPPFVNSTTAPYDLHINTASPTQLESAGTPITSPISVTMDYDDNTRNASTPDIGADEFNGIGVDITAPNIVYTSLNNTSGTANRMITATITDASGVQRGANGPRLYYKKSTDPSYIFDNNPTVSGDDFTFTINTGSLGGVSSGTIVEYYFAAQDSTGNGGTNPVGGSGINPPGTTPPGSPDSYTVVNAFSGAINVGVGQTYTTLTGSGGLFEAINNNVLTGNLTVNIVSDLTEDGTNALNQWLSESAGLDHSITIRPDAAIMRTISGSSSGGLLKINGADNLIIDGNFSGAGQYLTIQNTSTSTSTAAIHFMSLGVGEGSTSNTVKNCIIKAGSNTVTSTFGIHIGGTTVSTSGTGADNNNISILNNTINTCYYGIYARGTGTTGMVNNLSIIGNTLGSNTSGEYITGYGINLQAVESPVVTSNELFNMIYNGSKYGFWFGANTTNALVNKNRIHAMDQLNTTSTYYCIGIYFSSGTGSSNNTIQNNMIYDIHQYGSTSDFYYVGIRIVSGSDYKLYYNSISITGAFGSATALVYSYCLYVSSSSSNMDIRNNIFYNSRTGNNPRTMTVRYVSGTTFNTIDHNLYYTAGAVFGQDGSGEIADFNDWKASTGQDSSSLNGDPAFTSTTDLAPNGTNPNSWNENGKGIPITTVSTDIFGNPRSTTVNTGSTDIGAVEFIPSVDPATLNIPVAGTGNYDIIISGLKVGSVNITNIGSSPAPITDLNVKYFSGVNPPNSVSGAKYGNAYWDISPNVGASGYQYDLTLNYNNANLGTIVNESDVKIAKSDNAGTTWFHYSDAVVNTSSNFVTKTGLTSFSLFALSDDTAPLPVELSSFSVSVNRRDVNLSWTTATEQNNSGFDIERKSVASEEWTKISFVEGNGTTSEPKNYSFIDRGLNTGKYNYRLKQIDYNGNFEYFNLSNEVNVGVPEKFDLSQNYPNPFNPVTKINFDLPFDSKVTLKIYDITGREIKTLINDVQSAGYYTLQFDASALSSGVYFYRISAEGGNQNFVMTKKMMLVK